MLYTEEGLYLEWKVVSSRLDKAITHKKLAWMALHPIPLRFKFVLQGECTALPFSTQDMSTNW